MKNLFKYFGMCLLALLIGFGLVSCSDDGTSIDPDKTYKYQGFQYTGTKKSGLTIVGYVPPPKTAILDEESADYIEEGDYIAEIPASIDGMDVVAIGDYAFGKREWDAAKKEFVKDPAGGDAPKEREGQLVRVTIPGSVTTIGFEAFAEQSLTRLDLPNSVIRIGDGAFRDNKLEIINIPKELTSIGNDVFANNELTSVVIPPNVKTIGAGAFAGAFKEDAPTITVEIGEKVTVSVGENPSFGDLGFEDEYIGDTNGDECQGGIYTYDGTDWGFTESSTGGDTKITEAIDLSAVPTNTDPVAGVTIDNTTEYTAGALSWTEDGSPWTTGNFATGKAYILTTTLTAESGFTFTGVTTLSVGGGSTVTVSLSNNTGTTVDVEIDFGTL